MASAERCVRREVQGVRRLIEREAGATELAEFYGEQERFIAQVFDFSVAQQMEVKSACWRRGSHLAMLLDNDRSDEAEVWINQVEVTEPKKLAAVAMGEKR
jgi:hypothetical protein